MVQSQAVLELAVVSVSSQHAGEAAVSFAGDVAAGQPHLDGQEMAGHERGRVAVGGLGVLDTTSTATETTTRCMA